jgi:hypothetical protein
MGIIRQFRAIQLVGTAEGVAEPPPMETTRPSRDVDSELP